MKRALSFGVAFAIVLAASVQAQSDDSLRARARAQGGEATGTLIVDFSALSVPELTRKAQVIVHGRVVSLQTYLTADESMVMTDVTIAPTRLLKQTIPVSQRAQPGPLRPIIVRHVGGTVVEGALKMTTGVNMFPGRIDRVPERTGGCAVRAVSQVRIRPRLREPALRTGMNASRKHTVERSRRDH
jgi:hypothetical protein